MPPSSPAPLPDSVRRPPSELADAGAKVALLDLNVDAARDVAARIGGIAVRCDVADADWARRRSPKRAKSTGFARILVNCAGIGPAKRIVGRDGAMPLADFERVIAINLIGTFNMMRLVAADMGALAPLDDDERGIIVSTASVAAFEGQIGQAAYSASKGGVAALTMPAAREFAQFGIRVLAIAPGIFATPDAARVAGRRCNRASPRRCRSRSSSGKPEQFADLVLHCVRNIYLNGEVIRLDGALRMAPR